MNKTAKVKKNTSPFALTSEWRVKTHRVGFLKKPGFLNSAKFIIQLMGGASQALLLLKIEA